jgi:hypothetical protein
MLFYAKDAAQAETIEAQGLDASERLPLYLPAERARALAYTILKTVEEAEGQLKVKN